VLAGVARLPLVGPENWKSNQKGDLSAGSLRSPFQAHSSMRICYRERIEAAEEAAGRRAQPFEAWIASGCAESQGGGDASACEAR
jgi:hypothetical protein